MTQTQNSPRRYRLVIVNHGEDAFVEDTSHRDFGMRGRSCTVVRCQPVAAARARMAQMEADHQSRKGATA